MPKYAFKFISGKYQGGEFPIPEDGELLIGRAADLDMVLVEDMVSRKHAKLVVQGGAVTLIDLGSTNGTFVNGEKIRRAELKRNDRVLIGTSILKLVSGQEARGDALDANDKDAIKTMMSDLAKRAPATPSTMSGDLEEVPLPDLLQLFSTNKKTGVLTISGANRGRLYLKEGVLQFVSLGNDTAMPAMKALCRMLLWTKGTFQFETVSEPPEVPVAFETSTENTLIEAMRQNDESRRLISQLPSPDATLRLVVPVPGKLSDLSPAELDVLQLVINNGRMKAVLDKALLTDHEVLTHLQKLLKAGLLAAHVTKA
jgi:hypothetical protein